MAKSIFEQALHVKFKLSNELNDFMNKQLTLLAEKEKELAQQKELMEISTKLFKAQLTKAREALSYWPKLKKPSKR